jgi:light-regulated signal transduction histidine kinase (bacteriophytochrome)
MTAGGPRVGAEETAYELLRPSEGLFRSVVDNIGIGVSLISPRMEILNLNTQMKRWFPRIDDSQRPRCYEAFNDPPREDICPYCPTHLTLRDGQVHEAVTDTPRGGSIINYRVISSPIMDEAGRIIAAVEMVEDITARTQMEARLKATLDELRRSNAELEQFAHEAAHRLQEPLRMVASYTQCLAERYDDQLDDEARQFIALAVTGANELQRLLGDLLDYARVVACDRPLAPVDAHAMLGRAVANLRARILETQTVVMSVELPTIIGDAVQLAQVFQHLIDNAIKFRGSESPRIQISVQRCGSSWEFAVADNGRGIAAELQPRLFRVFERVHGEAVPGSGIGLALCKRIIERHGGTIRVESEPDRGAKFHFTLRGLKEV